MDRTAADAAAAASTIPLRHTDVELDVAGSCRRARGNGITRLGGILFLGELALLLVVFLVSRRVCRFVALAIASPIALTFFGYYEVGYLSVGIAVFPLIVYAIRRRGEGAAVDVAGGLQGLHAALHGFGLVGIAGGALAALAPGRRSAKREGG